MRAVYRLKNENRSTHCCRRCHCRRCLCCRSRASSSSRHPRQLLGIPLANPQIFGSPNVFFMSSSTGCAFIPIYTNRAPCCFERNTQNELSGHWYRRRDVVVKRHSAIRLRTSCTVVAVAELPIPMPSWLSFRGLLPGRLPPFHSPPFIPKWKPGMGLERGGSGLAELAVRQEVSPTETAITVGRRNDTSAQRQ